MAETTYTLGISPCPNDTFIFEALVHNRVPSPFRVTTHMADVEELNSLARSARLDITKLSLAAVLPVLNDYILLRSGAALGRGCGPLVVTRPDVTEKQLREGVVAIPGNLTTANLLLSLNGTYQGPRQEMVFDQIMPAVMEGKVDLGVIIHEGRFTYAEKGLSLVLDLGQWWEQETGLPLPLGVIAVRREWSADKALAVEEAIRDSLLYSRTHPETVKPFIRAHAQEMEESVMTSHINTFVNEFSVNLGDEGQKAILTLLQTQAKESGIALPNLPVFVG